jgi:tetratricopeptide (TPR) repeat protein
MKNKFILFCITTVLLMAGFANAQTAKGVTVVAPQGNGTIGKTWAVVVGISKYKNVQSLNYADRDAQAFYDYLTTSEGGPKLDISQIKFLKNENATSANVFAALDWLTESVKENDRVLFYFSGHGDLERKTISQNGFLLAYDSPVAAYMTTGTIAIKYVEDYMKTYVITNKAKDVVLFVDACRSGKLAGGEEGVRITMEALGENWNNQIIKILSAQEGELSYEDKKWGGGRGVFSYYLMKGIEGLADRNNDNQVTTAELAAYLPFAVADATGSIQNPKIDGNPQDVLFKYDPKMLAALKKEQEPAAGQMIASTGRGTADELSPDIQAAYNKYLDYVHQGRLLWGNAETDTLNCARHVYWQLLNNPDAEKIRPSLKSSFIAALQKKTNANLDDYVKGQKQKNSYYEAFEEIYYLKTIISPTYLLYNYVLARAYYSASLYLTDKQTKLKLLRKTIQLEEDAPYAMNELGTVFYNLKMLDSAMVYYQKALALAPQWDYPILNIAIVQYDRKDYKDAIINYNKAILLDSNFATPYAGLGAAYISQKDYPKAARYLTKALALDNKSVTVYNNFGVLYDQQNQYDKAIPFYYDAIRVDSTYSPAYRHLGLIYSDRKNYTKAIYFFKKQLTIDTADATAYTNLGYCYYEINDDKLAMLNYQKALKYDSTYARAYANIGVIYQDGKDNETALRYYKKALKMDSTSAQT